MICFLQGDEQAPLAFKFALVLVIVGIYLLPSLVAIARNHSSKGSIIVCNVFLGWSLLGWVLPLAWAFGNQRGLRVRGEIDVNVRRRRR